MRYCVVVDGLQQPIWSPSTTRKNTTELARFAARRGFATYMELHNFSLAQPEKFWVAVWDELGMVGTRGERIIAGAKPFWKTRFFPEASLNVAENLLSSLPEVALLSYTEESSYYKEVSGQELRLMVGQLQTALRRAGIKKGDRVAVWLPHIIETVALMLATTSIGAVFASTSPDFGVNGVADRFGQIEPKLLFVCDAYRYGGKDYDRLTHLDDIKTALPSLQKIIVVSHLGQDTTRDSTQEHHSASNDVETVSLKEFISGISLREPNFVRCEFDHPWYVLFSSGTTGKPKCIVHRCGGVLLKHLVEHQLHCDVKRGDRVFYYTTAGWMMWNWQVSSLASGAGLVLYDGAPMYNDGKRLFDIVDHAKVTLFGTSAKFIETLGRSKLKPISTHDLSSVRTVTSTGSTLNPQGFQTVYETIKKDVHLASISGGTDLCGCLVAGDPTSAVYAGEIQRAALGLDIDVVDRNGQSLETGQQGELVCRNAFPSMPLRLWDDPQDLRYRATYFEKYDEAWYQGDFASRTPNGGFVIHGRSDATLNPGGVRIGTAEIYRQVEKVAAVTDCVVIAQKQLNDVRIVLFVVLKEGLALDDDLVNTIKSVIRGGTTARHVPAVIGQVTEIPRTRSNKIVELAVSAVVHDSDVVNSEAIANPESLAQFRDHPALLNTN